ncbi:MAG: hypothetical protein ACKKL5_02630 [Candidatus Komeilibacteria bacterium]
MCVSCRRKIITDYFKKRNAQLIALLRDARRIANRNVRNGNKNKNSGGYGCWLGALAYLIAIEQWGDILGFKCKFRIINVLREYGNINERESYAIYALRCAFAHGYNLYNIPYHTKDDKLLKHLFTATQGKNGGLIEFPIKLWSGNFINNKNQRTRVNLQLLADKVECIFKKIKDNILLDDALVQNIDLNKLFDIV